MRTTTRERGSVQNANEILKEVMLDLFNRTAHEKKASAIEARNREWPKICEMLGIENQEAA